MTAPERTTVSEDRTKVSPQRTPASTEDPDATHWTAVDARNAFPGSQKQKSQPVDRAPAQQPAPPVAGSSGGLRTIRQTRKARLRLSRLDPWSVMKTSLMFGVAGAIIFFVAVWVVWAVIGASGAFDSINKAVNDLIASPTSETKFTLSDYVNTGRVLGLSAIIGVVDAVLFTALATLFSFLYNLAAQVMGGLEVTLAED